MPAPDKIISGTVYGSLTVLEKVEGRSPTHVKCMCDCGTETVKNWYSVKSGRTTSCGCIGNTTHVIHGQTKTRLHNIWIQIKARCEKPYASGYKYYGGRGISICDEWKESFEAFQNWALNNGYHPDLTIERKEVDGNYTPDNCIWATAYVQAANKNKRFGTKSEYIGVYPLPNGSWRAVIQVKNNLTHLGVYPSPEAAINARNQYIIANNLPHKTQ